MIFLKWLGTLLIEKVLGHLFQFIKERVRVSGRKKRNEEVVDAVEKAETEEDFQRAARGLAGRSDDDMGGG